MLIRTSSLTRRLSRCRTIRRGLSTPAMKCLRCWSILMAIACNLLSRLKLWMAKIQDGTGQFGYLVEACDPCEDNSCAYTINGIAVSDFITPHFYDPLVTPGTRYSFTGAIKGPRQILPGGYISWVNTEENKWQQLQYLDPKQPPSIQDLGAAG